MASFARTSSSEFANLVKDCKNVAFDTNLVGGAAKMPGRALSIIKLPTKKLAASLKERLSNIGRANQKCALTHVSLFHQRAVHTSLRIQYLLINIPKFAVLECLAGIRQLLYLLGAWRGETTEVPFLSKELYPHRILMTDRFAEALAERIIGIVSQSDASPYPRRTIRCRPCASPTRGATCP
jgi:hypothetical protein